MKGICRKALFMMAGKDRLRCILLITGISGLRCRIPIAGVRRLYRKRCRMSLSPLRLRIYDNITMEWIENTSADGWFFERFVLYTLFLCEAFYHVYYGLPRFGIHGNYQTGKPRLKQRVDNVSDERLSAQRTQLFAAAHTGRKPPRKEYCNGHSGGATGIAVCRRCRDGIR